MRAKGPIIWVCILASAALAILIVALFSTPLRIHYHKSRVIAAKREYQRLRQREYHWSDQFRELFLGRPRTWSDLEAKRKHHEQALVDLGFMRRVPYYPRRGKVPASIDPEFVRLSRRMDELCPWWSFQAAPEETSVTVTATPEALDLWKNLAPAVGLQEDKPKKEGCKRWRKSGHRSRHSRHHSHPLSGVIPALPSSVPWADGSR